jgi:hypothetical protein
MILGQSRKNLVAYGEDVGSSSPEGGCRGRHSLLAFLCGRHCFSECLMYRFGFGQSKGRIFHTRKLFQPA